MKIIGASTPITLKRSTYVWVFSGNDYLLSLTLSAAPGLQLEQILLIQSER